MTGAEAHQTRASRLFVPFCRSLLTGRRPGPPTERIPVREPDALTAEAIRALQDMIGKSVGRWLFAGLGWRRRSIVDPDDDEEVITARLWDASAWGALQLHYTAVSVDTLLLAWNTSVRKTTSQTQQKHRKKRNQEDPLQRRMRLLGQDVAALRRLVLSTNGDLLLHHLILRPMLPNLSAEHRSAWFQNPLNQMAFFDVAGESDDALERLMKPDLLPLMPWIAAEWPALWRLRAGDLLRASVGPFLEAKRRQARLWARWITLAEDAERIDLLVPLMVGYIDQLRRARGEQQRLQAMTRQLRLSERQEHRDVWAAALEPLQTLRAIGARALGRHPIDRLAVEKIYLAAAAELDLNDLAMRGVALTKQLRGDIG
ncbi:MAG: hypothetical protein AAFV53_42640 [Myxococcota bacterium]